MTLVSGASKIAEYGEPTMSDETSGSSLYSRMPASGGSPARSANAALISATVVGRSASIGEVDDRARRHRDADGEAVQAALRARG